MQKNYILLPGRGIRSRHDPQPVKDFFNLLNTNRYTSRAMSLKSRSINERRAAIQLQVLDSMNENGAKLVQVSEQEIAELRMSYPGMRILPEVFYQKALAPRMGISARPATSERTQAKYTVTIKTINGEPVEKAEVFLFTHYERAEGARAFTNKNGVASFLLPALTPIERLYVYPLHSVWPRRILKPVFEQNSLTIQLSPVEEAHTGVMEHFYPIAHRQPVSQKIKVGVIDTGVGPHNYIPVKGGANFVRNEKETDYFDNGEGHGTHVAGIIAGIGDNGTAGFCGLAPGVSLYSYRVFGAGGGDASNFAIMKAIDRAVTDGCDLINLSLGSADEDNGIAESIEEAYNKGVVCFAATGNQHRNPVSFPASAQFSIAVSAIGRKKTWPEGSLQNEMVKLPYGTDKHNFIAAFSNVGTQVDLTAPGVAIVSGFPGNLYAVMDGTSMACPAATAMAARLLHNHPEVFNHARNTARSNEMVKLVSAHAVSLGFGARFEGKGMLTQI